MKSINTISCKNISIKFEKKVLLNTFSNTFNIGELTAIKGLNGSGKSTLLKLIIGVQKQFDGSLFFNDKNIQDLTSQEIALNVSYVGTRNQFTFPMSVAELLQNGRYLQQDVFGNISNEDQQFIQATIQQMNIDSLFTKNIQTLSDGELQQVLIALAVIRQTPFIILDEPTSFLDYVNREKIWQLLVQLKNTGKGIIIASHDITEIEKYADKIVELS